MGAPRHEHKAIAAALPALVAAGYVRSKPTSYGLQVSLNPELLPEIIALLEN